MKKLIVGIWTVFSLVGCNPEGRVFIEHQELSPQVEWLKKDKREFKVPIENTDKMYNFSLSFRYASGYEYQTAKVLVTEITPSGKESTKKYALQIREGNGDYIGEPGFDIWDSEHIVEQNKEYKEKGAYTYVIEHNMTNDPLNYAMEIGVILDEVK